MSVRRSTRSTGKKSVSRKPSSESGTMSGGENTATFLGQEGTIPPAYQRLGGTTGFAFPPFLRTVRWATGLHKAGGKTTCYAQQRKTAYIDLDPCGGSLHVPLGDGSIRFVVNRWDQLEKIFRQMDADRKTSGIPFEHVVFDPVDELYELAVEHLNQTVPWCVKNGRPIHEYGDGKGGHRLIATATVVFPKWATRLGLGATMVGHLKLRPTRDEEGREVEEMAPAVPGLINDSFSRMAHFIWRHKSEVHKTLVKPTKKGEKPTVEYERKYLVETQTPPADSQVWTSANRGSRIPMPPVVELPKTRGIDVLEEAYETAVKQETSAWSRG